MERPHKTTALPWRVFLGLALCVLPTVGASPREEPSKPVSLPAVQTTDGKTLELTAPEAGVCVVVFYSAECPISNAYSPTLNRLAKEFPATTTKLVGLCVDPDLSDADLAAHARDFELKFPVASDRRGVVAARLGAKVTPESFVVDAHGRIRYHGRIDDQFAARQKRNENSRSRELHDAIVAVLGGREVKMPYARAVGCPIPKPPK